MSRLRGLRRSWSRSKDPAPEGKHRLRFRPTERVVRDILRKANRKGRRLWRRPFRLAKTALTDGLATAWGKRGKPVFGIGREKLPPVMKQPSREGPRGGCFCSSVFFRRRIRARPAKCRSLCRPGRRASLKKDPGLPVLESRRRGRILSPKKDFAPSSGLAYHTTSSSHIARTEILSLR